MLAKYSFSCNKCGKEFVIVGRWYNQMLAEWYLDYKFMWHGIIKHSHFKLTKNDIIYFLKIHISFIPLLILQVLDILAEPFRRL